MKYDENKMVNKLEMNFFFKKIKQNINFFDKQHTERGLILTIKCCVLLPKQGSKNPRVDVLLVLHVL
jgi:hypothetical protein